MKFKTLAIAAACLAAVSLSACNDSTSTKAASAGANAASPAAEVQLPTHMDGIVAFDAVQKHGTGFSVGPANAAQTVYVFFDPLCPHCAHLWQASQPLRASVRFVWMPVGLLGRDSAPIGATILASSDPAKAMSENEQSIADQANGITPNAEAVVKFGSKVELNSRLLLSLIHKDEGVPFVVAKVGNELKMKSGAMPVDDLKKFLGITS